MSDAAKARAIYRDQYRQTRRKKHGAGPMPVEFAKFAARNGFLIAYGKFHGMTAERLFRGLNLDCWGGVI